jgi:hypothetical protein
VQADADPVGQRRPFKPRELIGALEGSGVNYVAIGGVAVLAHGSQRITQDLDVMIEPTRENAERLRGALLGLEAEICMSGRRRVRLDAHSDPDWLLGGDRFFDTKAGGFDLRLRPPGAPPFDELQARAERHQLRDGLRVTVAAREDLAAMKRAAGRDKDLRDLAELRELDQGHPRDPG